MKRYLTPEDVDRAGSLIRRVGRAVDVARFDAHFATEPAARAMAVDTVVRCLRDYWNPDGGFGHGLESDFMLPDSSPMATSIGLRSLDEVGAAAGDDLVAPTIRYLERTFDPTRQGWFAVPRQVNDHPHAPWWGFDPNEGGTVIDRSWGNPTAELIGYIYKHRSLVSALDVEALVNHAVDYLNSKREFPSEHEVFCFIALHRLLPAEISEAIEPKLREAVRSLVRTDPREWGHYVPRPHHFASDPSLAEMFGFGPDVMDPDLDDLAASVKRDGALYPVWRWGQYPEAWERAKQHWTGYITLRALLVLRAFGRCEPR